MSGPPPANPKMRGDALRSLGAAVPVATLLAAAAPAAAAAATLHDLDVKRHRGRYELVAHTHLEAPIAGIFAVLTSYGDNGYRRISGIYQESGNVGTDADGTPLVYTLVKGCVAFFCKEIRRVSRLETEAPNFIRTTALPERSDFKYSRSEWRLEAVDGGTDVTYRLVMEPDFWVPPVIGPWLLEKRFKEGGVRALGRIERLAREPSPLDEPAA
ncbi:MAG TPA: hypothetical protein VFV10_18565, partial [Gammaproteobacteria bacterium]|nr:hypothetical protein [Gammaproteobacteria bacterium]